MVKIRDLRTNEVWVQKYKLLSIPLICLNHQIFKEKHFFMNGALNTFNYPKRFIQLLTVSCYLLF